MIDRNVFVVNTFVDDEPRLSLPGSSLIDAPRVFSTFDRALAYVTAVAPGATYDPDLDDDCDPDDPHAYVTIDAPGNDDRVFTITRIVIDSHD